MQPTLVQEKPTASKEELLEYLREMHEIRIFEDTIFDLLARNLKGICDNHLARV